MKKKFTSRMFMRMFILCSAIFMASITPSLTSPPPSPPQGNPMRDVSHEDIRDAILSLVHMFRDNTDKLERHEYRERQLGDQLKKTLAGIEKKQKTEETNINQILETLTNINSRLEKLENEFTKDQSSKAAANSLLAPAQEGLQKKLENVEQTVQRNELVLDNIRSNSVQKLEAILVNVLQTQSSVSTLENQLAQTVTTENPNSVALMDKFDAKLVQLQGHRDTLDKLTSLQQNTIEQMSKIQQDIDRISTADKSSCHTADNNDTINKLNELKYEIQENNEKRSVQLREQIERSHNILSEGQEKVLSAVSDPANKDSNKNVEKNYEELLKEIKGLSKIDQVLLQTADNVLDTKRRIEYGTHQILLEVGELIKVSARDTNETVNKRFDLISSEILENQNGGLRNLSAKLETEISQVWRQISIMYQTLTNSADALDKLQQQTEIYVNGSLSTMDHMEGKVGLITSRMSEVDDNLNYLLGRLSLVTQEFNQIKTGLGQALDNIRSSFHTVQEKVKDVGPGPNPIEEEDNVEGALKKTQYTVN